MRRVFRKPAAEVWTTYTYDASGRTLSVALPDGTTNNPPSTTTYVYQGNAVTVRDPAGVSKTFTMDALGNLTQVSETDPGPPPTTVYTYHTYDVLNHLIQVSMPRASGTQTRTFNYNTGNPATTVTGFLQSATNPENGTVTYTYTGNRLLASKTDAKGQQLTYQYDIYNRLTSVTWANNPAGSQVLRTYYYDTNPLDSTGFSKNTAGRLTAIQYASLVPPPNPSWPTPMLQPVEMYSYTQAGLPSAKRLQVNEYYYWVLNGFGQHTILPANLDSTFAYNSLGQLTATTYPSTVSGTTSTPGASYNYSYDSMNRLSGMTTSTGTTVVSPVTYSPANQLLEFNNEVRTYNALNQLTGISVGSSENLAYGYTPGANNGKINAMWNGLTSELITYTYDSLNRLAAASGEINNVVQWGEAYKFDPFGNLTAKTLTGGSGQNASWTVNSGNNRINGVSYDANGNATNVYNGSVDYGLGYDAENRLTSALQTSENYVNYGYDSQNHRIWSWTGSLDMYGNASSYTLNVYNPVGQKLAAYTLVPELVLTGGSYVPTMQVTLSSSDQYFGNRRLAVIDQLGSGGNNSSTFGTYFPWGEPKGTTNPQDKWSYATYWADSFTGLDYANNRYYSNAYGRFMTPDPDGASADPSTPQSWNRYPYVQGDPVNRNDPSGLDSICPGGLDPVYDSGGGEDGSFGGASCGSFGWGGFCDASQGPGFCDTAGIDPFCQGLIVASALSGVPINSNCANAGLAPVPVGVVDCIEAINDLWSAEGLVARRLAEIAAAGGKPDPAHATSLNQALTQLENAYAKVVKYCSTYVGAALAIEGAIALIDAATAVLIAAGA